MTKAIDGGDRRGLFHREFLQAVVVESVEQGIADVADLRCDFDDAPAGVFRDARMRAQGHRDRGGVDACDRRDVVHRGIGAGNSSMWERDGRRFSFFPGRFRHLASSF